MTETGHQGALPAAKPAGKQVAGTLMLVLVSTLFTLLFLEFVFFRFILPGPDPTEEIFENGLKYRPGQTGVNRGRNGLAAAFQINDSGWNSGHASYATIRQQDGPYRVAIIGDSFVDAMQVDYDKSLAERLEELLGPHSAEVFRFGISGAPLSHYLQILRKEVRRFKPDMVIFILIHNDFDESYEYRPGHDLSMFLSLSIDEGHTVREIEPRPRKKLWIEPLLRTATYRCLAGRYGVPFFKLKYLFPRFFGYRQAAPVEPRYQANIDVSNLAAKMALNEVATRYVLGNIARIAREDRCDLLLVMDGDRESVYQDIDAAELYRDGALALYSMVDRIAKQLGIPFIDLHPVFMGDYRAHGKRFNFDTDGHWNEYGHELVARTIYNYQGAPWAGN